MENCDIHCRSDKPTKKTAKMANVKKNSFNERNA